MEEASEMALETEVDLVMVSQTPWPKYFAVSSGASLDLT